MAPLAPEEPLAPSAPRQSYRFRLEVKPGCGVLLSEKSARRRPTALGASIQKAWRDMAQSFDGWSLGKISLSPHSVEGQLFFTGSSDSSIDGDRPPNPAQLQDVVQHFKRLCPLHDELWAPGFIEISEGLGDKPRS